MRHCAAFRRCSRDMNKRNSSLPDAFRLSSACLSPLITVEIDKAMPGDVDRNCRRGAICRRN